MINDINPGQAGAEIPALPPAPVTVAPEVTVVTSAAPPAPADAVATDSTPAPAASNPAGQAGVTEAAKAVAKAKRTTKAKADAPVPAQMQSEKTKSASAFGTKFSKADYETIVVEDDAAQDIKVAGLKRVSFKERTRYFLRLYPQETRQFDVHRIEDDPDHKAPIFCLDADCEICKLEKKDNPNAAPERLVVNLVYNKVTGAFGLWTVSVKQKTDGDNHVHQIVTRGSAFYQIKDFLASEANFVDLEVTKPNSGKFDIMKSTRHALEPTPDAIKSILDLLNEPDGKVYDSVVCRLTKEEMAELEYVKNMKKIYGSG